MCDSNLSLAGVDQQPGNLTILQKVHHIVVTAESSRMCCLPVVCCIPLLFPLRFYYFSNANWIVSSDHRSINMSMASLLHEMRIVLFEFFQTIFLHTKSTRFLASQSSFSTPEPSLSWQSRDRKDSGDKITSSFGTRTSF